MSSVRLNFLYPHLFRPALRHDSQPLLRIRRKPPKCPQKATFSSAQRRQQEESYAQRYGTAQEPKSSPIASSEPTKALDDKSLAGAIEQEVKPPKQEQPEEQEKPKAQAKDATTQASQEGQKEDKEPLSPLEDRGEAIELSMQPPAERVKRLSSTDSPSSPPASDDTSSQAGLASVMEMPAPTVERKLEEHKPPHLATPPYVHNFDTYTLVKNLESGGFKAKQSEVVMKGVRALLGVNLDVAKDGLVSKSDVENELYLFRAACSELRTEILNTRRSSSSVSKNKLTHLQHTYDILSQATTSHLSTLKDELKGMLNDRRMDNQSSKQGYDSKISELNYRISTKISSDAKSEVEGLRWVLTRRAAMTLGGMVVMILSGLQYSRYTVREREAEEKRRAAGLAGTQRRVSVSEAGTQTDALTAGGSGGGGGAKEGDVGYVSLG